MVDNDIKELNTPLPIHRLLAPVDSEVEELNLSLSLSLAWELTDGWDEGVREGVVVCHAYESLCAFLLMSRVLVVVEELKLVSHLEVSTFGLFEV